ncbi:hypothetical protein J2X76_006051 [Neorhizobium sp. 2083]|nr:hypothetical protein [Neorhizobium sp. 2083]
MIRNFVQLAALIVFLALPRTVFAHEFKVGDIEITQPYARAMLTGAKVGGGCHPCLVKRSQGRVALHCARKPMQNGYVESFNGRMRDKLLNESLFFGLDHARSAIAEWADDYNHFPSHSSLG